MKKIYVCGPTVYDHVHIGNLRPILTFDLVLRAYKQLGIPYKFVHNITDIDDKIVNKAIETNKSEIEIAQKYANAYLELLEKVNVNTITDIEYVVPNMPVIQDYVQKLLDSKNAYTLEDGSVYFDVAKNQKYYGDVSNQSLENMVFEDTEITKNNLADFALWKTTSKGVKFAFNSSLGRPGWHTECVALIHKHFGSQGVDIHGGGMDLVFPHHENENIQHQALFQSPLSADWKRVGQFNLNDVKMSKSLGNIIKAKDFLEQYDPNLLRMIIFTSAYSNPINITEDLIKSNLKLIKRIKMLIFEFVLKADDLASELGNQESLEHIYQEVSEFAFSKAMFSIHELIKQINKDKNLQNLSTFKKLIFDLGFKFDLEDMQKSKQSYFDMKAYAAAKNYEKADEIAGILREKNYI
ncbi:cysteine--tRNA ligase [Mycoplasma sp. Ms02]|uniref:cysteine--tRNA ligase n=1 Tax=Mycoplasma sp. Ms02 TaxID=353851 RepID=UPI001C89AF3B|nr:cysteine--tRNA ligase [Mycoplasma sp. Ms02]QZE12481.1 cysteine--tRNA ligase [Mycoplasma sp. Ms02]